jgi:hypothetical protein
MSNPISSLREEDVREQESQNPPEAESSFGDIVNQFEQTHTHESAGEQGREATVVAVTCFSWTGLVIESPFARIDSRIHHFEA